MKTFGEKLAEARKKKGYSQTELAIALELSGHNAVSAWERNKAKPNGDTLIKIAELLDISLDYLLLQSPNPYKIANSPITIDAEDYIEYLSWKNKKLEKENAGLKSSSEHVIK